ncbi:MAG: kynureninase [Anaerolineales bacterium]|nr:kynureninase [Anaerolineales bacterium]
MEELNFNTSPEFAWEMDAEDELARFRERFVIDDPDLIYLDGNSLGRLPSGTPTRLRMLVEYDWGERLIRFWNEGWFEFQQKLGDKIAGLVGASVGEVVVSDSTTTNLFKLAAAALRARPGRNKIVTDDLNFPSDLYVFQGLCEMLGAELVVVPSPDGISMPLESLAVAIDDQTALVSLSHVVFKSGFLYDMAAVNDLAHQAGALTLWDLSHSVGAVTMDLNAAQADLAVGCTYKYLNGGPGAPAFLYVRRDLQGELQNPIAGWFGQAGQFDFGLDYAPAPDIRRFLVGTPPMLSMVAIESGVNLLLEAGMEALRRKSVMQTEYMIYLWEQVLAPLGFRLNTPRDPRQRGSHVSLGHDQGLGIDLALIKEMKVLPDFRQPDNLRLGIAPIYTRYTDIYEGVMRMRRVIKEEIYKKYIDVKPDVT